MRYAEILPCFPARQGRYPANRPDRAALRLGDRGALPLRRQPMEQWLGLALTAPLSIYCLIGERVREARLEH